MQKKILILDFGSQYTQLIARRVRELDTYCEIHPFNNPPKIDESVIGVVLSGSPFSTLDENAPQYDLSGIKGHLPLLGVCYGAQYIAKINGGNIEPSKIREYGRANISYIFDDHQLMNGVPLDSQVWMSHGDTITQLPEGFKAI
ncbi:MAG: GMP synthase (glutamine-hydrolyzing), partial [Flavobacteriales bacterium]|nr:GMP synthase (glutamine-hydrolyzing) [Flavobacteriales bacterium]